MKSNEKAPKSAGPVLGYFVQLIPGEFSPKKLARFCGGPNVRKAMVFPDADAALAFAEQLALSGYEPTLRPSYDRDANVPKKAE